MEAKEASEREKYQRTYIGPITLAEPSQIHAAPRAYPSSMFLEGNSAHLHEHTAHHPLDDDLFLYLEDSAEEVNVDKLLEEQFQTLLLQALHLDGSGPDEDHLASDDMLEEDMIFL
ncbi:hypothetical protein DFJ43DRAFT_1148842 [Lentinula guzmanii]|uniref:Uncharacterized protein n=1 Tax=Lentinula guzmanii TaxID=2804957 RepID=A0AA38JWP6_9AGAR|nr:hypothetical protein DFJ43DRAFT_1148842 [Lentinula guzmanii]